MSGATRLLRAARGKFDANHLWPDSLSKRPRPKPDVFIHQIYYDRRSRQGLDRGFIPLDNAANQRPDWFEFWPILNFLKSNKLEPNAWYGFLSPKFRQKTNLRASFVINCINALEPDYEVALFSPELDQLACWRNPFMQGDFYQPGLTRASQQAFDAIGVDFDLAAHVTCMNNSVFSNYIVAKPSYWDRWLSIAAPFFDLVERQRDDADSPYEALVDHDSKRLNRKVFIQERIASVVLAQSSFKTFVPEHILSFSDFPTEKRRLLTTCDCLKEQYCLSGDPAFLTAYDLLEPARLAGRRQP